MDTAKIKALRERQGLTMDAAARAAGFTSRQAWYKIESGRHMPRVDTLEKMATALGVKTRDLLK